MQHTSSKYTNLFGRLSQRIYTNKISLRYSYMFYKNRTHHVTLMEKGTVLIYLFYYYLPDSLNGLTGQLIETYCHIMGESTIYTLWGSLRLPTGTLWW